MADGLVIKDGKLYGDWRQPINIWMDVSGSIHNDAVAQGVGMRGGTIPGTVHLNLFGPLFVELWGTRWWEKGNISMYYTYATTHREEVRAVIALPPKDARNVQVEATVETPDGHIVARGTVAVGEPKAVSNIRAIQLEDARREDLRILADLKPGMEIAANDNVVITQEMMDKALETNTDPLDWYRGKSPWGGSVMSPTSEYQPLNAGFPPDTIKTAVGFFGGTEIRHINGPIKVGVAYRQTGKVICVGASPKTEFAWVDSWLHEKATGKLVADMRHMTRWMKAGSLAWQEQK